MSSHVGLVGKCVSSASRPLYVSVLVFGFSLLLQLGFKLAQIKLLGVQFTALAANTLHRIIVLFSLMQRNMRSFTCRNRRHNACVLHQKLNI